MKGRKNMRTVSLLIVWIVLCALGCSRSPKQTVFYRTGGIKALSVIKKKDSLLIYKEFRDENKMQRVYSFYKQGDNYYTDDLGDRELVMSRTLREDTVALYENPFKYRAHEIRIKNVGDTIVTMIFMKDSVGDKLPLLIVYDKDYQIKAIRNWMVDRNYMPSGK